MGLAAGAAAGAAIGSIIPGAGTLVGAGLGFLAGMGASYATNLLAENSGASGWVKRNLGGVLNNYNQPLGHAWDGISNATHAVSDTAGRTWEGVKAAPGRVWNALTGWLR